ncbi:MAG: YheV family putative metal-binding protein [Pseudomonadales bacterium]
MADSGQPRPTRRFIAGAICPACGLADKIYVETNGKTATRNCCRCDFTESLDLDGGAKQAPGEWQPIRLKE